MDTDNMANIAAETGATSPTEPARPVTPTQQIPSSADLPEIDVEPVTFHDVAGVAGSYARGWVRRASDFLAMHTLLAGVIAELVTQAKYPETRIVLQEGPTEQIMHTPQHTQGDIKLLLCVDI